MKNSFPNLSHLAPLAMLAGALVVLSGCVADDVMNDDGIHYAAHASDNYPLQAMRGHAAKCGNWPEDLTATSQNLRYSNQGCAVQANIAAELANPSTINTPMATDLPMGAPAAAAVRNMNSKAGSGGSLFGSLFGP
jgi:hypothetical protein